MIDKRNFDDLTIVYLLKQAVNELKQAIANLKAVVDNKVSKSGDEMSGSLTLHYGSVYVDNSAAENDVAPSSTIWSERIFFRDKNRTDIGYVHPVFSTDGRQGISIRARRRINGADQDNALTLAQAANGARSVSVSDAAAWREALAAVNKAGDTMTGSLGLQNGSLVVKNTTMDTTAASQSAQQNDSIYHYDKNNRYAAYWQTSQTTAGTIITSFAARRYLGSANVDNYLRLAIANNGTATVGLSHPAAWLSALGLIYEKNDTMTITASMDITGHTNANSTVVYLSVTTSKSMESISTVTVTSLNGWFAGPNGALNGSSANVNYANTTGYSIATLKLDNYHVRIVITKSSAFTNSVNNGAANYFGTLTLKFT